MPIYVKHLTNKVRYGKLNEEEEKVLKRVIASPNAAKCLAIFHRCTETDARRQLQDIALLWGGETGRQY